MEFPDDAGQFDYIIAHGIYSWVPRVVQEKLLAVCRASSNAARNGPDKLQRLSRLALK